MPTPPRAILPMGAGTGVSTVAKALATATRNLGWHLAKAG